MERDLKILYSRQRSDGGFGLWTRDEQRDWPYVTVQVARVLSLAATKGFNVDGPAKPRCLEYLRNIRSHMGDIHDEHSRDTLEAVALNVRYLHNDQGTVEPARKLIRKFIEKSDASVSSNTKDLKRYARRPAENRLPLDCAGWLLPILRTDNNAKEEADLVRQYINSQVNETASTASVNAEGGGFGEWNYCLFYSPRRTDAIILEALMLDDYNSDLIPKLVRGLLGHRKNGKWEGTQENSYVLQALSTYFARYESKTPDFDVNAWLGESLIASQKFAGRSTETKIVSVPISFVQTTKSDDILIDKKGPGRLYYRLGLNYVPRNLEIKPADFGFEVERTYEPVDSKSDVRRDQNGVWHIKAGATVRSRVRFTSTGPRYHVALMDPLPGGAEPVNTALLGNRTIMPEEPLEEVDENPEVPSTRFPDYRHQLTSSTLPNGDLSDLPPPSALPPPPVSESEYRRTVSRPRHSIWWWRSWYEHENLRDHQAEAFASVVYPGTYDYTYTMRATTPGDYRVPPTKVEEMYAPETFGRASSEHVIIE
jgi:hypothetical protein